MWSYWENVLSLSGWLELYKQPSVWLIYMQPNTVSHNSVIHNPSDIIDNSVNSHGWQNIVVYIYWTAYVPIFLS